MNITYDPDRWLRDLKAKRAESLLPYDLGDELLKALEIELVEPLDDPKLSDVPDWQKQRMRETGF